MENLKEKIEEQITKTIEQGITTSTIDYMNKLMEIHKNLAKEEYYKEVVKMNYRNYNDNYGRRGVPGTGRRYRGEEALDTMYGAYQDYQEGNYGHQNNRALEHMMRAVVEFVEMLKQDANSQQELEVIQRYSRQISDM